MRFATLALPVLLLLSAGCASEPPSPSAGSTPSTAAAPSKAAEAPPADGEAWTCTMHREVRMHEEGRCPKCNMFLVKEGAAPGAEHDHAEHDGDAMAYYCPMHPKVRSAEPGRCSECNMFLVKQGDEASHGGDSSMKTMDSHEGGMSGESGAMQQGEAKPAAEHDEHDHGSH